MRFGVPDHHGAPYAAEERATYITCYRASPCGEVPTDKNYSMNVLILEDEIRLAEMLAHEVAGLGRTVLGPVRSMTEALKLGEEIRPDLALINISLAGGRSGTEAAAVLNFRWDTPCLFVTAKEPIPREYATIAIGYLESPYGRQLMREAILVVEQIVAGEPVGWVPAGMTIYA